MPSSTTGTNRNAPREKLRLVSRAAVDHARRLDARFEFLRQGAKLDGHDFRREFERALDRVRQIRHRGTLVAAALELDEYAQDVFRLHRYRLALEIIESTLTEQ